MKIKFTNKINQNKFRKYSLKKNYMIGCMIKLNLKKIEENKK